jgi:hypothetical protein
MLIVLLARMVACTANWGGGARVRVHESTPRSHDRGAAKRGSGGGRRGGHLTVMRRAARISRLARRCRIIGRRIRRRVASSSHAGTRLGHGRRVMRWGTIPRRIGRAVISAVRRHGCMVTCGSVSLCASIAPGRRIRSCRWRSRGEHLHRSLSRKQARGGRGSERNQAKRKKG